MDATREFFDMMEQWLSKSDIYEAEALGNITTALLQYRAEREMNQKDLAAHLGVTQSMVSKWESGDYNFTIRKLAELCEQLGLSMELKLTEAVSSPLEKYIPSELPTWFNGHGKEIVTPQLDDQMTQTLAA